MSGSLLRSFTIAPRLQNKSLKRCKVSGAVRCSP